MAQTDVPDVPAVPKRPVADAPEVANKKAKTADATPKPSTKVSKPPSARTMWLQAIARMKNTIDRSDPKAAFPEAMVPNAVESINAVAEHVKKLEGMIKPSTDEPSTDEIFIKHGYTPDDDGKQTQSAHPDSLNQMYPAKVQLVGGSPALGFPNGLPEVRDPYKTQPLLHGKDMSNIKLEVDEAVAATVTAAVKHKARAPLVVGAKMTLPNSVLSVCMQGQYGTDALALTEPQYDIVLKDFAKGSPGVRMISIGDRDCSIHQGVLLRMLLDPEPFVAAVEEFQRKTTAAAASSAEEGEEDDEV